MNHFLKGTAQITLTGTAWPLIFPGCHAGILLMILTASLLQSLKNISEPRSLVIL